MRPVSRARFSLVKGLALVAAALLLGAAWVATEPRRQQAPSSTATPNERLEAGRDHFRRRDYPAARAAFEDCLTIDVSHAECHKLLGATLGQLGDGLGGAKEYELFLKYAPDTHPQRAKVELLLDAFYGSGPGGARRPPRSRAAAR